MPHLGPRAPHLVAFSFLSSALTFAVQPAATKALLPAFGGGAAVWAASLLFFQACLLAGYLLAHAAVAGLGARRQATVHALVVAAAMPFLPWGGFAVPTAATPDALSVAAALWAAVGIPAVVLGMSAPLVQAWHAAVSDADAGPLYAAGNAGALAVVVAYPFLVEPFVGLAAQAATWSAAWSLLALLAAAAGLTAARAAERTAAVQEAVAGRRVIKAAVLAGLGSYLLSSGMAFASAEFAPVPLSWSVAIGAYLLSYVLAFSRLALPGRWLAFHAFATAVAVGMTAGMVHGWTSPFGMAVQAVAFTAALLLVHGRLASLRPASDGHTVFYLAVAAGGVLGTAAAVFVTPHLLPSGVDYFLAIAAACLLRPASGDNERYIAIAACLAGVGLVVTHAGPPGLSILGGVMICAAMIAGSGRPVTAALVAALAATPFLFGNVHGAATVWEVRGFFGTLRVAGDSDGGRALMHGTTMHGLWLPAAPCTPTLYYGADSPLREALEAAAPVRRAAVVGLGAGALAALLPDAELRFYDVDPLVVRAAREHFGFLNCATRAPELVVADGRVGVATGPDGLDAVVLDAFASDAIPLHLLTAEALQAYAGKLAPRGILVAHISNRHMDLRATLGATAAAAGLEAFGKGRGDGPTSSSSWAVLARPGVATALREHGWEPLGATGMVWTDDRSSSMPAIVDGLLRGLD